MLWAHDLWVWLQGTSLKNCATLIPSGMLNVGWSWLALPAFSTSRFNLASILHIFIMLWHDSVVIFYFDDKVIVVITREFCHRMTYSIIWSQLRVHFQTWWWYQRPILCYIKMILVKQGVVVFCTKSACRQYKKSYDRSILSENPYFFTLWGATFLNTIKHHIVLYRDSSLWDWVDFLVSKTDAASYFVHQILVEKIAFGTT